MKENSEKPLNLTKFSIIVPTYNEEEDIAQTLACLEMLNYPEYDVLVVDDGSRDKTVKIVKTFADRLPHFRLLSQPANKGVAGARNRGILESKGDVVVILNADVLLPPDYLQRIAPYYQQGKQWVAPVSRVKNLDHAYSRFTDCEAYHYHFVERHPWVWSEGFSCTKEAALAVGMFPEAMPGCSGEDVEFGADLEKRFDGVKATEITVCHLAPDRFAGYWGQQKGRGKGRTHFYYYVRGMGLFILLINSLGATAWRILKIFLGVPIINAWRYCDCSTRKKGDFIPFVLVGYLKEAAMLSGMWSAFVNVALSETVS